MIEVLSPAGTYESFKAAITAGADAVYLGGSMFGARAFAGNFNEQELIQAIEYAHICNRKVFLTVNTLLKEKELEKELFDYLCPYYEKGLDAVIVQDYGVFRFIKRNFPNMDIHASTQMTISGHYGATLLSELGASRIVTARELTLTEIAKIREANPNLEIESFVHGALCYCYSGQCLMSSLIGGRSGNRGRCAQSCRLPYDAYGDGIRKNNEKEHFLLSPKDMCALENLPQVIEAGVNSLKIEGRMKSPEYTAGVVSMYRKYVDLYLKNGKEKYFVDPMDMEFLMDLYNRGNFTKGYYTEQPGKNMMSMERPNHQGVAVLKVTQTGKGFFTAKPLTALNAGDVVEITSDYEITIGAKDADSKLLTFRIPSKFSVKKDQILYRTRNQKRIETIRSQFIEKDPKNPVSVCLKLNKGDNARLSLKAYGVEVTVEGSPCMEALNQPVSKEQIHRQINKFGNTLFAPTDISIQMDSDIFIPMGAINELRRNAVQELEKELAKRYYRCRTPKQESQPVISGNEIGIFECRALVSNTSQYKAVAECQEITGVYLSSSLFEEEWVKNVRFLQTRGKKVYLAFPPVFREKFERNMTAMLPIIKECGFDGYLVRSLCQIEFIKENGLKGEMVCDHNLYAWNYEAMSFLYEQGAHKLTAPLELNESELRNLNLNGVEMIAYGYYPMMISAQCLRKNVEGCKKGTMEEKKMWHLMDRKKNMLPVVFDCKNCLTTIYNVAPVHLLDRMDSFLKWNMSGIRLEFTIENENETKEVLEGLKQAMRGDNVNGGKTTRGHFTRGVE